MRTVALLVTMDVVDVLGSSSVVVGVADEASAAKLDRVVIAAAVAVDAATIVTSVVAVVGVALGDEDEDDEAEDDSDELVVTTD